MVIGINIVIELHFLNFKLLQYNIFILLKFIDSVFTIIIPAVDAIIPIHITITTVK
jgi:hypothetical protein